VKLIRLTDERYVLDVGPDATQEFMYRIHDAWEAWWRDYPKDGAVPTTFVVGGGTYPLEYEDHRDPESQRLAAIEARLSDLEGPDPLPDDVYS